MSEKKQVKNDQNVVIIRKKDSTIKSKLLKATMAQSSCCRGERA